MFQKLKSVWGLGGLRSFMLGWSSPINRWGKEQQLRKYQRYIHSIVSAIAEDVARSELVVKNGKGAEQETHPLVRLLRRPNPDSTQFQFLEMHQTYIELAGESFWYLVYANKVTKKPSEMYLLRPDLMEVVVDEDSRGLVKGYAMQKGDGTKIPFDKHEIIHHKLPNPINPYRGMSPVEAAMWYVQTEELVTDFTRHSLHNSGRPSGVVNFKGTVSNDDFEQLKKRFKQEYSGTANAGKLAFVRSQQGMEFTKLSMDLSESSLKALKDMSRDDLMFMWRVSKTMLGITDDVNRANAKEARAVWLQNVIQPKVWRLTDQLQPLLERYGDYTLDFKSQIPADHEEAREDFKAGIITLNEARTMIGHAELPNGDIRFMPLNMIEQGKKREPEKAKTKSEGLTVEQKEAYRKSVFARQEAWQKKYQDGVNKVFEAQKDEILNRNAKAFEEWKFDQKKSKERFVSILHPITSELMLDQALEAMMIAGDTETEFILNDATRQFINDRIERFATDTDQETIDLI